MKMRVPSLAKAYLREMALDLGGAPGFDPEKQRKIERGEHPYARNPAFPREPAAGSYPPDPQHPRPGGQIRNYAELIASDQYRQIAQKVSQAVGIPIQQVSLRNGQAIVGAMMQAFMGAVQFESEHIAELERLAVDLVLELPEFDGVRRAYENDQLRIKAHIVQRVTPGDMQGGPQQPDEEEQAELEIAQIAQELDVEKEKRRFVNMLIQGAAINKNHAYHLVADRLNELNPQLLPTYAVLMAVGDWMYWVMPDENLAAMMGEGEDAAGKTRFYIDDDGVPVIDAEGKVFPVLIQEIVKGMWEFVMWRARQDAGADPDTERHVYGQVDTLQNEPWDIMMGPAVWRQVLRMIGPDNQKYTRFIYQALLKLPTQEWHRIMNAILRGEPAGRQYLDNLVQEIKADHEGGAEEEPPQFGGGGEEPPEPPGGGGGNVNEPDDDWWKKESAMDRELNTLLRRVLG